MKIHPTAIISPNAKLADDVEVGAYAVIDGECSVGAGTVIEPMARLHDGSIVGERCRICSFVTVAGEPQDLHFDSSIKSFVEIGDGSVIREGSTLHRATIAGAATKLGRNALMMANSHIGHDCVVGDNFIMGCFSALAGHCKVANNVFISGGVMVHQKIRVGDGVIASGTSAFSLDIPPFVNAFGRNDMTGINIIGMKRRGISGDAISEVRKLYSIVFANDSVRKNALAAIEQNIANSEAGKLFLDFFKEEGRHFLHPRHVLRNDANA